MCASFYCTAIIFTVLLAVLLAAVDVSIAADLVTFEAESGSLGSSFVVSNSGSPGYITILTDGAGNNPGSAARVASYTVTFPTNGTYQLYARHRRPSRRQSDTSGCVAKRFHQCRRRQWRVAIHGQQ